MRAVYNIVVVGNNINYKWRKTLSSDLLYYTYYGDITATDLYTTRTELLMTFRAKFSVKSFRRRRRSLGTVPRCYAKQITCPVANRAWRLKKDKRIPRPSEAHNGSVIKSNQKVPIGIQHNNNTMSYIRECNRINEKLATRRINV